MEFVKKKVNIDVLNPFSTSDKKGHTNLNRSSAKADKLSEYV